MAGIKSATISHGGKNRIVEIGSKAEKKYMSSGGIKLSGDQAKSARIQRGTELRALGKENAIAESQSSYEGMGSDPKAMESTAPQTPAPLGSLERTNQLLAEGGRPQLAPGGAPNTQPIQTPTAAPTPTQNKYRTGFEQAKATGMQAPTAGGEAMATKYIPPPTPTSVADNLYQEDEAFQTFETKLQDYFSPKKQRESLVKEYDKMMKKSGIEGLDMELIDMKNVIDGTENDIRNEITKAGGFASDSQVLALTNSRNKVLIKNYNTLLETRNAKQSYLDKMMDLSVEDRKAADDDFDRKMNFAFKIQDYKDKMKTNAIVSYERMGYPALLKATGGDPYYTSLVEKTLGFPPGGLATKAAEVEAETSRNARLQEAQIENIYSTISDRESQAAGSGTISGKPQNATQSAANSYANRLAEANVQITNLGNKFTGKFAQIPTFNALKTADRQIYEQAQNNFITAVLRRESGASIAPTEFETARKIYFPMRGDLPEVVAEKEKTRNTVINNFYREADVLRPTMAGDIIESGGKKYKVGMDGETLTEL